MSTVADRITTRDLLSFARQYLANHSVYDVANRVEAIENDAFIRTLASAPDMTLAQLEHTAEADMNRARNVGCVLALASAGCMAAGALTGGMAGLPLLGFGIGLVGITFPVGMMQARRQRFLGQLQNWEATLNRAASGGSVKTP